MQDFIIKELSKINFDKHVESLTEFIGTESELSIVFVGVGKTAYVAKRLTASFISMNVSCRYLHAADALHGDMGIVGPKDLCILLSYSGETKEVLDLARYLNERSYKVMSITNKRGSSLEDLSDRTVFLNCSNGLPEFEKIPSISLYAMEILFDLFLVNYCKLNNKSMLDFSYNHPSGGIGSWFSTPLKDLSNNLADISIEFDSNLDNISKEMDRLETGIACIITNDKFVGCLTSGDIRRLNTEKSFVIKFSDLNENPVQISNESSVQDALEVMKDKDLNIIFLTNSDNEIVSYVSIRDLIK